MLRSVTKVLVCLLPIGALLYLFGLSLPDWIDPDAAVRLIMAPDGRSAECVNADWYVQMDALRTWRHPLMNLGLAMLLFAATSLSLLRFARQFQSDRLSDIVTPSRPSWLFILGIPAWAGVLLALGFGLGVDQQRHAFPWCADTILIPLVHIAIAGLMLFIAFLVFGLVLVIFMGRLPVPLTQWDPARPIWSTSWTVIFGLASVVLLVLIAVTAVTADFLVTPSFVVGIYLLLATRAALLAPRY